MQPGNKLLAFQAAFTFLEIITSKKAVHLTSDIYVAIIRLVKKKIFL